MKKLKNSSYFKKLFLFTAILLTLFLSLQTATATNYYVDPVNGDDINSGLDPSNAFLTINKGVTTVTSPTDVVNLAEGTYSTAGDRDITVTQSMTIQGAGKDKTIINAQHLDQVFRFEHVTVTLADLTIINGKAPDATSPNTQGMCGGAIYNHEGTLTINNCRISDNEAGSSLISGPGGYGGAIHNTGTLIINNCELTTNKAGNAMGGHEGGHGGAISSYGSLTIKKSVISGNQSGNGGANSAGTGGRGGVGGGIYCIQDLTLINSIISNNLAGAGGASTGTPGGVGGDGGGIYIASQSTTITGSHITGNRAGAGGTGTITGSKGLGDGIYLVGYNYLIKGNNIINNFGTGIYIPYYPPNPENSIVWSMHINFNRIVENTLYGLYIPRESPAGAGDSMPYIDATNNWWGSNSNPRSLSKAVYDPNNYAKTNPWLVLSISTYPTSVAIGGISVVTANVIYNNLGEDTSSLGHIPDGTPITITTDLGNVGSKQVTKYTINGIVTAVLRANEGSGIAHLYAILDGFRTPIPATVTIGGVSEVGAKTIGMQKTGASVIPAVLAFLLVVSGMFYTRKQE